MIRSFHRQIWGKRNTTANKTTKNYSKERSPQKKEASWCWHAGTICFILSQRPTHRWQAKLCGVVISQLLDFLYLQFENVSNKFTIEAALFHFQGGF